MKSKFQQKITSSWTFRFKSFNFENMDAMISRKGGRPLIRVILRLTPVWGGRTTKAVASITRLILVRFSKIAVSQGIPGLVKYLKSASVRLQQWIGGMPPMVLSPRIGLTNDGLPRVLPIVLRSWLRKSRVFAMKMALTLFSLYRDFRIPAKIKLESITKPFSGNQKFLQDLEVYIPQFCKLFCPNQSGRDLLKGRFSYFPINKSSPQNLSITLSRYIKVGTASTNPFTLIRSALLFSESQLKDLETLALLSIKDLSNITKISSTFKEEFRNNPVSVIKWIRIAFDSFSKEFPKRVQIRNPYLGKLGLLLEPAGKMRVFAMVDPWTQMILKPFHSAILKLVSRWPMDGTFDQLGPLKRAWGSNSLYSMDLSSATDRLPISLQASLLGKVFSLSEEERLAWIRILVDRPYGLPSYANRTLEFVKYSVGQPMGAYSSWAMLALTHHFIVQAAAWRIGYPHNRLFMGYAVLGDDIVIFDKKVAKSYHRVIQNIGVECNLSKSIISPKGIGLEFAKKTFYKGINVSPTPLKELFSALQSPSQLIMYGKTYGLSLAGLVKVAGFGFRVLGGLNRPLRVQNYKICLLAMGVMFTSVDLVDKYLRKGLYKWMKDSTFYLLLIFYLESLVQKLSDRLLQTMSDFSREWTPPILVSSFFKAKGPFTLQKSWISIRNLMIIYELIYSPYKKRSLEEMANLEADLLELFTELRDYIKYDISISLRKNFPIEFNENVILSVKSLLLKVVKATSSAGAYSKESLELNLDNLSKRPGAPKIHRTLIGMNSLIRTLPIRDLQKSLKLQDNQEKNDDIIESSIFGLIIYLMKILLTSMIKTLQRLSKVFGSSRFLTAISLSRVLVRPIPFGARISLSSLSWVNIKRILLIMTVSQISLALVSMLILSMSLSTAGYLKTTMFGSLLEYWPISYEMCQSTLSLLWKYSSIWSIIVTINHWTDLTILFHEQSSTYTQLFGAILSYLWVINYSMAENFFSVLINDPTHIWDAVAIRELRLIVDSIGWSYTLLSEKIIISVPSIISPYIGTIFDWLSGIGNTTLAYIHFGLASSWNWLVVGIQSYITPSNPIAASILEPVTRNVASLIGGWLLWWIIRWLFFNN